MYRVTGLYSVEGDRVVQCRGCYCMASSGNSWTSLQQVVQVWNVFVFLRTRLDD